MVKEKFDYNKHLLDTYINDGKAWIKVYIDNKDEFYNIYDPNNKRFNKNVASYLLDEVKNIPSKYEVIIDFSCDKITDEEKNRIKEMIKTYYALKIKELDGLIRINRIKSYSLFLLGILFVIFSFVGGISYGVVYEEIVNVIGWVLLWEGIDILVLSNSESKVLIKDYKQLLVSEIVFSDKLGI